MYVCRCNEKSYNSYSYVLFFIAGFNSHQFIFNSDMFNDDLVFCGDYCFAMAQQQLLILFDDRF